MTSARRTTTRPSSKYRGLHPVAVALVRKGIREDVTRLERSANLQAWASNHAANLVNLSGRLAFIVGHAACACQVDADHPDMRILRGMGEAIGDLAQDFDAIEQHRPAILSGCAAIGRLLPFCNDWALGLAAVELDQLLASSEGMGTSDLRRAMGVK